jgi:hypothetical protein
VSFIRATTCGRYDGKTVISVPSEYPGSRSRNERKIKFIADIPGKNGPCCQMCQPCQGSSLLYIYLSFFFLVFCNKREDPWFPDTSAPTWFPGFILQLGLRASERPMTTEPNNTDPSRRSILVAVSADVVRGLEAATAAGTLSAFVERAIRRELGWAPSPRAIGRPRKHSVEDLVDCLGLRTLTTGEFFKRANETLDCSRATFFRLLERGRREWRFRQDVNGKWRRLVSQSQMVL